MGFYIILAVLAVAGIIFYSNYQTTHSRTDAIDTIDREKALADGEDYLDDRLSELTKSLSFAEAKRDMVPDKCIHELVDHTLKLMEEGTMEIHTIDDLYHHLDGIAKRLAMQLNEDGTLGDPPEEKYSKPTPNPFKDIFEKYFEYRLEDSNEQMGQQDEEDPVSLGSEYLKRILKNNQFDERKIPDACYQELAQEQYKDFQVLPEDRKKVENREAKQMQELRPGDEPESLKQIQLAPAYKRKLTSVANHIGDRLREDPPYQPTTRVKADNKLHPWDQVLVSHDVLDHQHFNYV